MNRRRTVESRRRTATKTVMLVNAIVSGVEKKTRSAIAGLEIIGAERKPCSC